MKNNKSLLAVLIVAVLGLSLSGCAVYPTAGWVYTNVTTPSLDLEVESNENNGSSKTGTAKCSNILGIVATGDCGVGAAMRDGGITRVHHVDQNMMSILGLYSTWEVRVVGE